MGFYGQKATGRAGTEGSQHPSRGRRGFAGRLSTVGALALVLTACGSADGGDTSEGDGGEGGSEGSGEGFFGDVDEFDVLVAHGTGGGTDIQARFLAPWVSEKLAGQPSPVVTNVPGGGTILGANEYANMEPTGTNLWYSSASTTYQYLLNHPEANFEFSDYVPLFGVPTGSVVYGTEPVCNLSDMQEPLITSEQDPSGLPILFLVAYEVLGIPHDPIFGYNSEERFNAVDSGETNASWATYSQYHELIAPRVEDGDFCALFSVGQLEDGEVVRDPAWPDMPTIKEVYEELHGEEPAGESWEAYKTLLGSGYSLQKVLWVHKDAPEAAITELQAASEELASDGAFAEEAQDVFGPYEFVIGEPLQAAVDDMLGADEAALSWLEDFLSQEYDYEVGDDDE